MEKQVSSRNTKAQILKAYDELYDHQADPHETVNIAAAHPEVVAKLKAQLEANAPAMRKAKP